MKKQLVMLTSQTKPPTQNARRANPGVPRPHEGRLDYMLDLDNSLENTPKQSEATDPAPINWCDTTQLEAVVSKGMFIDGGSTTFERSWPKHNIEGGCCSSSKYGACKPLQKLQKSNLAVLLHSRWRAPAYLLTYAPPAVQYRLSEGVFDKPGALHQIGGALEMQLFLVDVDKHGVPPEQVNAWFEAERPKLEKLRAAHGCLVYRSRGGYRILGVLPRPFAIRSSKQVIDWKRLYMAWLCYLGRAFDIGTDSPADELVDWQRLQRVPHDLRSEDGKPEEREILGDTKQIGYWDPPLTEDDHEWAANQIRDKKIGAKGKKYPKKIQEVYTGRTVLRILLEQRGLLGEEVEDGKFNVICPGEDQHSTPNRGEADGDTVLYENGGRLGHLHCLHAGCGHSRLEQSDWLRKFDDADVEAARKAAGVSSATRTTQDPAFRLNDPKDWREVADVVVRNLPRYVSYRDGNFLWSGNRYEQLDQIAWHARIRQVSEKLWSVREDNAGNEQVVKFHPWSGSDKEIAIALKARPGVILDPDRGVPFALHTGVPDPADLVFLKNMWVNWFNEREYDPTDEIFVLGVLDAEWKSTSRSRGTDKWRAFLRQVWPDDPDSIALLQEWFGAMLCRLHKYQKFFYLKGPKAGGKGTIARVLLRLLGKAATTFENGGLNGRFDLEDFIGRDVAICPDAVWSGIADPSRTLGRYLQLAGGDDLRTDRKNKSRVPLGLLILMLISNELPELKDLSSALLRRLTYLETTKSFDGALDLDLTEKLCAELEGIVRWALEGAQRLWKQGAYTQPKYHAKILEEIQELCSPPTQFINDCIEWGDEYLVQSSEVQSAYAASATAANRGQFSETKLGIILKNYAHANGHKYAKDRRQVNGVRRGFYLGLRLRVDALVVHDSDLENLREWIGKPMEWALDDEGRRRRQTYSKRFFRLSDVLTHALDVQKVQQPREEERVRRTLAALGHVPDTDGKMFFLNYTARPSELRLAHTDGIPLASAMPAGYEDYAEEEDADEPVYSILQNV